MTICMYTDLLVAIGYIAEEWWDKWTAAHGNMVDIDVPEDILRAYYFERLAKDYDEAPFEEWYYEESTADDMDGLFGFTEWRPFLADVVDWG